LGNPQATLLFLDVVQGEYVNETRTMHRKHLGTLGEVAVAKAMMSAGLHVFVEFGDLARVDLIALDPQDGQLYKVQVKTIHNRAGAIRVKRAKAGPNYSYTYQPGDFDILAIYLPENDEIAYLRYDELQYSMTLRIDPTRNNQKQGVRWFCDYTSLERVLRDHEQDASAGQAGGEDMAQTTTEKGSRK
jgi:hypothetical protein